ncbi:MAG: hypothetical protein HWN79_13745 [Candidatus Lokiarchaeota archaeon]|nr:hypothetical protein [Candidatus Lokiarchaeota archaeon]
MNKNTIFLTGFEKFGKYSSNLSSDIVRNFDDKLHRYSIEKIILPVSWKRSIDLYLEFCKSNELKPSLVILLGIYSKKRISLEKVSLNWVSGKDMDGKYKFGFINKNKSLKLKTILNIKEIYKALKSNIRLAVSYFPGFYLCNFMYFWALDISKNEYPVLFIHIPKNGKLEEYSSKIKKIIVEILKTH